MSKLSDVMVYLNSVSPTRDYSEYERHKKNLEKIVEPGTDLWIEIIKELTDRMFI